MDIVEQLRQNTMLSDSIEKDAADEIVRLREENDFLRFRDPVMERLRKDNERLRNALTKIKDHALIHDDYGYMFSIAYLALKHENKESS